MNRYQADKIEVLVPHLHGASTKPPTGKQRIQWTEERYFKDLEEKNEQNIINIVKDLYKWSQENADRIWFGTGVETGSFTFHYLRAGRTISPFTIFTNGKLWLNYGYLLGPLTTDTLEKFHGMIHEIPGTQHIPNVFAGKWPSVKVEALKDPENLKKFKQAVLWLQTQQVIPRA